MSAESQTSGFKVVIPARLGSTRLPRKVLREVGGKPVVQHVWEAAQKAGSKRYVRRYVKYVKPAPARFKKLTKKEKAAQAARDEQRLQEIEELLGEEFESLAQAEEARAEAEVSCERQEARGRAPCDAAPQVLEESRPALRSSVSVVGRAREREMFWPETTPEPRHQERRARAVDADLR